MTRLDEIPTAFEPPAQARPSEVVARIRSVRPSRRAVLRGLVIGAAATALVPIDWYLARREASAQEEGRADDRSEHLTCTPESYTEESNNWPSGGPAVCYGGWRRGSYPCSDGYHREGEHTNNGTLYDSTRLTTNCHGKNAWRWNGYRCSDAISNATFADGTKYNGVTIAACALPTERTESGGGGRGGGSGGGSGGGGDAGGGGSRRDPALPIPLLGTGASSLPGLGSLLGR